MRAEAENANVRTRARKDVDDTRQYAVQKFATDVVEAAENLKRGIDSLPPPSDDQPAIVGKGPRRPGRRRTQLRQHTGAKRDQAGRPGRPAVRPQPASGDGGAGKRSACSRHGDAGLVESLDVEWPAAASGHGCCRQGAGRGTDRPRKRLNAARLIVTKRNGKFGYNPCPGRVRPIHP